MKTISNIQFEIVTAENRVIVFGSVAAPVCCCMCCIDTGG